MRNVRTSLVLAAGLSLATLAAAQAGPINKQVVDPVSATRGQQLFATNCSECHGQDARGTSKGVDLMVSSVLLHDRYGSELGPFLLKGHPSGNGEASTHLTTDQIRDLSNYLHQEFYKTLSRRPPNPPPNIVVGNVAAGQAFFDGAGQCSTCHSPTGDLARIATRDSPYELQQSFVFPGGFGGFRGGRRGARGGRGAPPEAAAGRAISGSALPPLPPVPPAKVTIASVTGPTVSGDLVTMDDFNVTYKDSGGQEHTLARTPGMTITTTDPLAFHHALLKTITDEQIHDVVAYLETLK